MADVTPVRSALDAFISTPTAEKLLALNQEAEAYRERWIESRSGAVSSAIDSNESRGSGEGATRYKRIKTVHGKQSDGTELVLALQYRTSRREGMKWHVVSWRSRLSPGGHNRRFYLTAGRPWSMPADLALQMLESLNAQGGLESRFDDTQRRPDFDVTEDHLLTDLTMEGEGWSPRTKAIVLTDPHVKWRKVMLFDPDNRIVTFRSLTKDTNYMPRADLRPGSDWFLDNSMQDSNVQQARVFLERLRSLLGSR